MTHQLPDAVTVELDSAELGGPTTIGTLQRTRAAGGSILGFAYDEAWLASASAFAIDPLHGLYAGTQWPRDGQIDRILGDASTDRWGRTLMSRREAVSARREQRPRHILDEWDYLLGVSDVSRMGALRFRSPDGRWLDDGAVGVPPMARLPELSAAAQAIEQPRPGDPAEADNLAMLLAPGSSLGGARPKASFLAEDGSLWMAKFPSRNDSHDVAACEWALNELAAAAGIEVPEHRLLAFGRGHRTFAARRFDRGVATRRMYASAMTLLSRRDREPASYLDIALAIADHGERGSIDVQLASLFRRVVFNVLVSHRDDHPRNHGFLRTPLGWHLAPAFDLNPLPDKAEHELALDEAVHAGDIDLVIETAPFYRLTVAAANGDCWTRFAGRWPHGRPWLVPAILGSMRSRRSARRLAPELCPEHVSWVHVGAKCVPDLAPGRGVGGRHLPRVRPAEPAVRRGRLARLRRPQDRPHGGVRDPRPARLVRAGADDAVAPAVGLGVRADGAVRDQRRAAPGVRGRPPPVAGGRGDRRGRGADRHRGGCAHPVPSVLRQAA